MKHTTRFGNLKISNQVRILYYLKIMFCYVFIIRYVSPKAVSEITLKVPMLIRNLIIYQISNLINNCHLQSINKINVAKSLVRYAAISITKRRSPHVECTPEIMKKPSTRICALASFVTFHQQLPLFWIQNTRYFKTP